MNKIKNFLCTTSPSNLTFGIVMFIVLFVEGWFIGFKTFVMFCLVAVCVVAVLAGFAYGLYRLIKYLQTKCEEAEESID